jgi:hypothetical protein
MKTRSAQCVVVACLGLLWVSVADAAGQKEIERFTCFAANLSDTGRAGAGLIEIGIERWSTDAEREALRGTLIDKGPDALLSALQKIKPRVGYMRRPSSLAWDLYYAREVKREDGTRQIILASDRPIAFREVVNSTRSEQYAFTIIDIRFDAEGKGTGQLAGAAKVSFNKTTNHIEIESYGSRPIDLINVKSSKP